MKFNSLARYSLAAAGALITIGPAAYLKWAEPDILFKSAKGYDAKISPQGVISINSFPHENGDHVCTSQHVPTGATHDFSSIVPSRYQSPQLTQFLNVSSQTTPTISYFCEPKVVGAGHWDVFYPPAKPTSAENVAFWTETRKHACIAAALRLRLPTAYKVC